MDKFIPVTTELSLRLRSRPFLLPLERDGTLPLTTVRSCFGQSCIGLKYAEGNEFKVVAFKCSKFYPPKKVLANPFIVIYESSTLEADHHLTLQTTDNPARHTRHNQTKPANSQSQPNTSSAWSFQDVEFQDLGDLGTIKDFKLEASLLEKWCT